MQNSPPDLDNEYLNKALEAIEKVSYGFERNGEKREEIQGYEMKVIERPITNLVKEAIRKG